MPNDLPKQIATIMQNFTGDVDGLVGKWDSAREPTAFRAAELSIAKTSRELGDKITEVLQDIHKAGIAITVDGLWTGSTALALFKTLPSRRSSSMPKTTRSCLSEVCRWPSLPT